VKEQREALAQIESALADMLDTYAELRSEYLKNAPPLQRVALEQEIAGIRQAGHLVRNHRDESASMGLPSWRWHDWEVKERAMNEQLAEFLAVGGVDAG
jgi:hypothetical protein